MLCAPEPRVAPATRSDRPRRAVPLLTMKGPPAMGALSDPTVPRDTAAPAVATLVTVKLLLPGRAPGPVSAEATVLFEEVATALLHTDCPVMASGTNALAAV